MARTFANRAEGQKAGGSPELQPGRGLSRAGTARGLGSQGYVRADERIREEICLSLADDQDIDASEIEVTVEHGRVRLSGTISDARARLLAQSVAALVRGVEDVDNRLGLRQRASRLLAWNYAPRPGARDELTSLVGKTESSTAAGKITREHPQQH